MHRRRRRRRRRRLLLPKLYVKYRTTSCHRCWEFSCRLCALTFPHFDLFFLSFPSLFCLSCDSGFLRRAANRFLLSMQIHRTRIEMESLHNRRNIQFANYRWMSRDKRARQCQDSPAALKCVAWLCVMSTVFPLPSSRCSTEEKVRRHFFPPSSLYIRTKRMSLNEPAG